MESNKQIRSSVIAKSMRFNGLFRPLDHEKLRVIERKNQSKFNSGFTVIPTKELCRVYLQKHDFLASKGVIDARSTPPHDRKKSLKSMGLMANQRKFGRRYDQQNSKSKLRHCTGVVESLKLKSVRSFSPLGFGSDSHLRVGKKGQYISLEKKSKEMDKVCDGTTTFGQKKDRVVREVGSKLKVSTSRDSVLSLERICNDRVAADSKLRYISSSGFISKGENDDSLDCSNASPGCQTNSEEAHQPSPVSILEPIFIEDMLDDSEELPYLDFHGIEEQLETLKSDTESYSDGSGMEVSSDEESVLDSETKESNESEPVGLLDTQESRDLSYIDDILAEVVLGDKNWVPDKRDSLDLVITSKIFEKLEKKYQTETSWKRSERRVLFDRVNSGLVEVLESFRATPTWKKPVSRRLGADELSSVRMKQELWKVLARQEKRAKKEPLANVPAIDIGDWLELEADDESVVMELESMIVDELLDEVVSFI